MKIDSLSMTVTVPYISRPDIPYKHADRFTHLRVAGTRYGDRSAELIFERLDITSTDPMTGETITEPCVLIEREKAIPLRLLASIMQNLQAFNLAPKVKLISRAEVDKIREDLEALDKAEEAAKKIDGGDS